MAAAQRTIAIEPNLQAKNRYGEEPDSAYGDEVRSYTTSLASSATDYQMENNRRYHAYKQGSYVYPNDQKESERLDIMHVLTEVSLGGTGTGIWAMEIGDKYPAAEILGNDLSPIQPRWVPPNVRFEIDDVEADWIYHEKFDYIHCRFMGNAIKDWPRLLKQCMNNTNSGGWVECIDLDLAWTSPDGSLKPNSATSIFNQVFLNASRAAKVEPCPGPLLEGWMKDAGFKDVKAEKFVLPVGTWPADKHLKEVGAWNYLQVTEGLEAFTYALFTRYLGYSQREVDVVCSKIRAEIKDRKLHAMFHLHVAYGRKP